MVWNDDKRIVEEVADSIPDYTNIWGRLYQTSDDYYKKKNFRQHMNASYFSPMREAIDSAFTAFKGDLGKLDFLPEDQFKDLLYYTGRHESWTPDIPARVQENGPARGWWQVEPATARDIVTAYDKDKETGALIKPRFSTQYWGPKATKVTGFSAEDIYNMSDEDLGKHLETNDVFGAAMAMSKYLKAFKASK